MQFSKALRLIKTPHVAFAGSGGKTTAISILAKELSGPVIITTTTHMGTWQSTIADRHLIIQTGSDLKNIEPNLDGITLVTGNPSVDRLSGLNETQMDLLYELCEKRNLPLLIECDGSRQLPIKAPAMNEPVIPGFVETVVVVAGLASLGRPLNPSVVHHPDIYSKLSGLQEGDTISIESLEKVLCQKQGGLKNIPAHAKKVLLLNQAETVFLQAQAGTLAGKVGRLYENIIVSELKNNIIHAVFEPTAAIILAAGQSSRYGRTKQLLSYHGIPFIRAIVRCAMNSNLSPIIVVAGADADPVKDAISDLSDKIIIIHNPDWQEGQSSSIRAGIKTLRDGETMSLKNQDLRRASKNCGSAIFLLADQPQTSPAILRALVEEHCRTLSAVIAPLVDGRRGNPVIFDRSTFPDLIELNGDIGGRGVFPKYPPEYIQWYDSTQLDDIDTIEDYERLLIE
jgi:molybdenum cofactor cytidylyltransferase